MKILSTQTASEIRSLFDSGKPAVYVESFVQNPELKSSVGRVTLDEVQFAQINEIDDSGLIKPSTSIIRS